jgi:Cu2+-exporting ATPase/Cu+-exporting ATPase
MHIIDDSRRCFCCPGCFQVFLILAASQGEGATDFRDTVLFRACVKAGIIPGGNSSPAAGVALPPDQEAPALELTFRAEGMWCPSCSWLIEEVLKKTAGVMEPGASFFTDTVRLRYLPHIISPEEVKSRIRDLGYRVPPVDAGGKGDEIKQDLLIRLGISAILTMNVMMLSAALYSGFIRDLTPAVKAFFSYPALLMSVPVIFYGGMPTLKRAWSALRFAAFSMDSLIALGALSAFGYSLVQLFRGSLHLYFDTACMLVTVLLLGRYMELHARERVFVPIASNLEELIPTKVRLTDGLRETWTATGAVRTGDRFLVKGGERLALDGRVRLGYAFLDQSVITGEPAPVRVAQGDEVFAGALVTDGELEITTSGTTEESSLARISRLMRNALEGKDKSERRADSIGRLFVPGIICLALSTGILLAFLGFSLDEIILRCLTVLVISCPCAIGIAAPLAKVAVIGLGRRKGVLIKNPEALERTLSLDTMVFDKTGTLTEGRLTLLHVVSITEGEEEIFAMIAPLEAKSAHFLGREILLRSEKLGLSFNGAVGADEKPGLGVTGSVGGRKAFAGNRELASLCEAPPSGHLEKRAQEWEKASMTVVFFGWDGKTEGFFVFGDALRKEAREVIDSFAQKGIRSILLSGDSDETVGAVARNLGITDYSGRKTPSEKAEIIEELRHRGHKVGMAGDGLNDAVALAAADVGFSVGARSDILKNASDLIIPGSDLRAIVRSFGLGSRYRRTVRLNLIFAFIYNVTVIPIAAAGFLNPMVAVGAMFLSSLTVTGNALRVSRKG